MRRVQYRIETCVKIIESRLINPHAVYRVIYSVEYNSKPRICIPNCYHMSADIRYNYFRSQRMEEFHVLRFEYFG